MHSPPVIRTALNFGALNGLGLFTMFLLLYYSGINALVPTSWHTSWVPILFMILGTRYYRNAENHGFISYWQGFRVSFLTASCGAFVFATLAWIFGSYIDGNVLEEFKQRSLEAVEMTEGMMKSMVGESAYEQYIEDISEVQMSDVVIGDFNNKIIGGLIASLVVAAFLRKDPKFED